MKNTKTAYILFFASGACFYAVALFSIFTNIFTAVLNLSLACLMMCLGVLQHKKYKEEKREGMK